MEREYINFNKTIILICVLIIFLPIIIYIIRTIIPVFPRCLYYDITGEYCPFCGITTDLRNILQGEFYIAKNNILTIPIIILTILEVILRLVYLKYYRKVLNNRNVILIDVIIHGIIFFILIIYCIRY